MYISFCTANLDLQVTYYVASSNSSHRPVICLALTLSTPYLSCNQTGCVRVPRASPGIKPMSLHVITLWSRHQVSHKHGAAVQYLCNSQLSYTHTHTQDWPAMATAFLLSLLLLLLLWRSRAPRPSPLSCMPGRSCCVPLLGQLLSCDSLHVSY